MPDLSQEKIVAREIMGATPPLDALGVVREDRLFQFPIPDIEGAMRNSGLFVPSGVGNMLTAFHADSSKFALQAINLRLNQKLSRQSISRQRRAMKKGLGLDIGHQITITDIDANVVVRHRECLRVLHRMFQKLAVSSDQRASGEAATGFMFADTVKELKHTLSAPGAQILVATDEHNNLLGMLIYHLQIKRPPSSDRTMVKIVASEKLVPDLERTGIAHVVGIDPRLAFVPIDPMAHQILGEDPKSRRKANGRRLVSMALQACMVLEARRHSVDSFIGYVRTAPNANKAVRAHGEQGYKLTPFAFEVLFRDPMSNIEETVRNRILVLDARSPLQDSYIKLLCWLQASSAKQQDPEASPHLSIRVRDFDPA